MTYTDAEIRESWRKAKDKDAHVQVLAELNGTDVKTMGKKLVELGLIPAPPAPKKPPFDETRAMELYNEGLCDLDIAEMLGVCKETVGLWRRGKDLPPHRQKGTGLKPASRRKKAPKKNRQRRCGSFSAAHRDAHDSAGTVADFASVGGWAPGGHRLVRPADAAERGLPHGVGSGRKVSSFRGGIDRRQQSA